jgi:hypothetical protein
MATLSIRMPVVSVDLSMRLTEITHWGYDPDGKPHTQFMWWPVGRNEFKLMVVPSYRWMIPQKALPAFDMAYLQRNTPASINFDPFKTNFLTLQKLPSGQYVAYYADVDNKAVTDEYSHTTAEDTLALLIINLTEKNIFRIEEAK